MVAALPRAVLDGATVIGETTRAPHTVQWTPRGAGGHSIHAITTDNCGVSNHATASFNAGTGNPAVRPPAVEFADPGPGGRDRRLRRRRAATGLRVRQAPPASPSSSARRPTTALAARSAFSSALKKAFLAYPAHNAGGAARHRLAGIPCHDETFQVTGQLSYAGVSAVATIDGGVNISTTGSAGVIGNLNLFGMKVGKLRGFLTATDDQGRPDPSLCADLEW